MKIGDPQMHPRKSTHKWPFEKYAFRAVFLQMSEICTILGLVRFEAKNSKHIFPGNERNYSGNKHA